MNVPSEVWIALIVGIFGAINTWQNNKLRAAGDARALQSERDAAATRDAAAETQEAVASVKSLVNGHSDKQAAEITGLNRRLVEQASQMASMGGTIEKLHTLIAAGSGVRRRADIVAVDGPVPVRIEGEPLLVRIDNPSSEHPQ